MNAEVRKVVVSGGRRSFSLGPGEYDPSGYRVEAEYHPSSAADRDAVLAFVERVVRIMQGGEEK